MELGGKLVFPKGPTWSQCLPPHMLNRASLQTVVEEAAAMGCIRFRLPSLNAVAGGVLRHAIKTLEELFDKHSPMIFKVGFSHDPVWRWANTLYGYHLCRDNWSDMVVLFLSDEPFSVAMLEAALIEKIPMYLADGFGMFLQDAAPRKCCIVSLHFGPLYLYPQIQTGLNIRSQGVMYAPVFSL